MTKKLKYGLFFVCCLFFVFVLTGCSAGDATTYDAVQETLKETQKNAVIYEVDTYIDFSSLGLSDEELTDVNTKLVAVKSDLNTNFDYSKIEELLTKAFTELYNVVPEGKKEEITDVESAVKSAIADQLTTTKEKALEQVYKFTTKKSKEDRENHQVYLCEQVLVEYNELILNATSASLAGKVEEKEVESKDVYQLVKNYTILIQKYELQEAPLQFYTGSEFWSHLFNNLIVFPIGWLIQAIAHLCGGYYILGLLIVTILVRTLGWPIYAKTNDMSLKMSIMQPELQKLEAKYANRPDPDSQRMKQMEQMQLYKKYKVGMGGCLMPLLQFPIFMGIYRAVSRMQYTDGTIPGTQDWVSDLNTNLFGVDLFKTRGEFGTPQFWGIIVILVIVVGTQILSQVQANRRQKKMNEERQANIPEYRRQAVAQNDQAKTMKYMMYFMIFMMGMFVWQSAAGLGVYWCIGNVYSMAQTYINNKMSGRRMEKMKKKFEASK
ncbi:MAG: membrane protein insertase YidC [Bacilli bacterium]|nr:membrane protein insertase YidC [Bacilli bacterium]